MDHARIIIQTLAESGPYWNPVPGFPGEQHCVYCLAPKRLVGTRHYPTCLWLQAQQWREQHPERRQAW